MVFDLKSRYVESRTKDNFRDSRYLGVLLIIILSSFVMTVREEVADL